MLRVSAYTTTSALGIGKEATWNSVLEGRSGLAPNDFSDPPLATWIGRVPGVEEVVLPEGLQHFECRNHRLATLALRQDGLIESVEGARERYGPQRVGVFLGTSTSGIGHTEAAYRVREGRSLPGWFSYDYSQSMHALSEYVSLLLGLSGPSHVISTACSSSAKVFATAWRHILAGVCDAAVVGGCDSLCMTTLCGFHSLQLISEKPCRPWDVDRDGISIGEAAGFVLLERGAVDDSAVWLLGYGESSDAWHMSSPHPEGKGARMAMEAAICHAGLPPTAVSYINLHGTGTPANDAAEDRAVVDVFGSSIPCSSTKGYTGHTLGAAGITEAVIGVLALENGFMPGSVGTNRLDPGLRCSIVRQTEKREILRLLSNSFGFGGSNCSLLFGRA